MEIVEGWYVERGVEVGEGEFGGRRRIGGEEVLGKDRYGVVVGREVWGWMDKDDEWVERKMGSR